jgi:hypothetical protein
MKYKDLVGIRFGKLLVQKRFLGLGSGTRFLCKCDCGKDVTVYSSNLTRGLTKSCGCNRDVITSLRMSLQSWGRKFEFQENYFHVLDSEDKAYWLGFIAADGNVYKNTLQIALGGVDRLHLYKFMDQIKLENPPIYRSDNDTYLLRIHSKQMIGDINGLGIFPNKSLNYIPPKTDLLGGFDKDFWRGMVDGDGWIIKNNQGQLILGLCGTFETCEAFLEFLLLMGIKTNAVPHQRDKNKNTFSIEFGGKKLVPIICRLLYGNLTTYAYLSRKFRKAVEFSNG